MACQGFLNLMLKYVIWKAAFNADVGYTALFAAVHSICVWIQWF